MNAELKKTYTIGDKVKVKDYDDLPDAIKHKGIAKKAGKRGEIVDVRWSNAKQCDVYLIHFDGYEVASSTDFVEGSFDRVSDLDKPRYTYEFEYLENLVVARLYELRDESKIEIAKGHGHIFHDGVLGVAQAASYALKKIYHKLEDEGV